MYNSHLRLERGNYSLLLEIRPVDGSKERLLHHLLGVRLGAKSPVGILGQQLGDEFSGFWADYPRVEDLLCDDQPVHLLLLLVIEGKLSGEKFIEDDPQTPPVYRSAVLHVADDLGNTNIEISHFTTRLSLVLAPRVGDRREYHRTYWSLCYQIFHLYKVRNPPS